MQVFQWTSEWALYKNRAEETSWRKKGSGLLSWLTHCRGMLIKKPCLIQIRNAFSTAAPSPGASLKKNWALWVSGHFLWMRCFTWPSVSSRSLFLFLSASLSHSLSLPPSRYLAFGGQIIFYVLFKEGKWVGITTWKKGRANSLTFHIYRKSICSI